MSPTRDTAALTTLATAADALRDEETVRTRAFLRAGWVIALGVVALVFAIPGDPRIAAALLAVIGTAMLASLWLHRELHRARAFDPRRLRPLALCCVVACQLGVLYVGCFSAAPIITVLGLYLFCRTESRTDAIVFYALAAGAHGIEACLLIGGVIDDPGFYETPADLPLEAAIAGQLVVQATYAVAFAMARLTRRASLRSIEELQEATRLAAQHAEQLDEVRRELDRALKIGGPGRFTGHRFGAWDLGPLLGRGGMGEVYEATRAGSGDAAAVKVMRRDLLGSREHVERFLREVRAASTLDAPNVVRVLDASTPEDPIPFFVMERLRGRSLDAILRRGSTLARADLDALVTQVGEVLERARLAGIVHRDIKPHNLFCTDDGAWKVLDFGVARLGESAGTLTHGAVVGTPSYMAPEQAKGAPADHRADLYAFGTVIYRCVTGRLPFTGRDTPALLYKVVHEPAPAPSSIAAVGPAFDGFLAKALAKAPAQRFQSAAELVAAFQRVAES